MRKRLVALILLSAPFSTATLTAGTAEEQQACCLQVLKSHNQ